MKKIIKFLLLIVVVYLMGACNLPKPTEDYRVFFKDYDLTVLSTQKVAENEAAIPPEEPTREGYTFVGWDKDFSKVTENMEIIALYEINKFTVTFVDHDDSVLKTETVSYKEAATAPENPSRVGYQFVGWDNKFANITADLTIKALYDNASFIVQFVDADGSVLKTEEVAYGKDATPPTVTDLPGYTFTGWDLDYKNVSKDLVITAQYDIVTFTVIFVDYDDTILKELTVEYGKDAVAPLDPVRIGYKFIGWDQTIINITADLTVTAVYDILTFTVQFVDVDGTVLKNEVVEYGKNATAPTINDLPGYTFTGWDQDYTKVINDLVVTAQYEIETFTVTFLDLDDIILKVETVEYGKAAIAPEIPDHIGYDFIEWDQDFDEINEDLTVKAVYQIITYNITYHKNATHVAQVAWPTKEDFLNEFYTDLFNWISDNASKISNLTKTGSTFSMTRYDRTATWSNVAELRALDIYDFERTIGTLFYKPFTRVDNEPIIPEVNPNYFLNAEPYRSKYIDFDGYFLNAMITAYPAYDRGYNQVSYGRVQIFFRFHQWTKGTNIPSFNNYPNKYILTENENVVMPSTHLTYTVVDEFVLPEATCEGMTFLGWYDNPLGAKEPITEIKQGSYRDLQLYAKWDNDLSTNEVIFLDEDGKIINTKYIKPGETVTPPTFTPKLGYRFVGWDKDITNITSDIVVTAKFEIITYTITYHDNLDGVEAILPTEPVSYTIHDKYILPNAYLEGYLFLGWYDNPECEGLAITETTAGDLDLYAYFIKIPGDGETIGDGTVELVATDQVVQVNRSTQVYAKIGDVYITSQNLHYISTNEDIATIDAAGFVCAKAEGEVVIIVVTSSTVAALKIIVVDEPYQVKWVGHQGSGGPVVQNTVSAFHEGGRRGYYAMECDVRVSSDGVYYICHDDVFKSSLFVDSSLWDKTMGSYTWNQLKDLQVKDTYGGTTYYGTLATVEEYLLICKQYGAKAVLELKWTNGINSNDQSRLSGLVELVKQCEMYENAIFLSSMKNCLTYIRQHYPDANIQFLSGTTTTTLDNINWCIQNKFSLDAPHNLVTADFVNRIHNAYLYVNAYTVNDNATENKLKNFLVDMITTDNLGV